MADNFGTLNLSQTLFQNDEKLMKKTNDNYTKNLMNTNIVSSWPAIDQNNGIGIQFPAYLNQANQSRFYQNFGSILLANSSKFGVAPMGGEIKYGPQNSALEPAINYNEIPKLGFATLGNGNYQPIVQPPPSNNVIPVINNNYGIYMPSWMQMNPQNYYNQ